MNSSVFGNGSLNKIEIKARLKALPYPARLAANIHRVNHREMPLWTIWFMFVPAMTGMIHLIVDPSWLAAFVAAVFTLIGVQMLERRGVQHLLNLSKEELDRLGIQRGVEPETDKKTL